jgi:hypothetical protein
MMQQKGNAVTVHAVKAHGGYMGIAPHVLNLGARWRLVINFTTRPLYRRERTAVPTEQEGGRACGDG